METAKKEKHYRIGSDKDRPAADTSYVIYDTWLVHRSSTGSTTILNNEGDTVLQLADNRFLLMDPEESGTAHLHISSPTGKFGFASLAAGKIVIAPVYDSLFTEGYTNTFRYMSYKNGRQCWFNSGYQPIDLDSMSVISTYELLSGRLGFSRYEDINNSVFIVRSPTSGKAGIADATGKLILLPQYDSVHAYQSGYSAFTDGKWGFLDPTGKTMIPFEYDFIRPHYSGIAEVTLNEKKGIRSFTNEELVPAMYDRVEPLQRTSASSGDHFIVCRAGRWGMVRSGGKITVPVKYRAAEWVHSNTVVRLERGNSFRLYNVGLMKFISPREPLKTAVHASVGGVIVFSEIGITKKTILSDGKVIPNGVRKYF